VQELEGFAVVDGAEHLQRFALFKQLSYEETSALAGLTRRTRFRPGEVIIEQDALGQALHLILSGRVRVVKGAEAEVLGSIAEGELFGEMSLVDDLLTSARVVAETEVETLAIDRAPFEKLLAADARLAAKVYRAFCRQLSERLRRSNEQLAGKAGLSLQLT